MAAITPTISTSALTKRRAYARAYYHRTKERRRELAQSHVIDKQAQLAARKRYYTKRKTYIAEQRDKPCADCGGTFPTVCMDFHHPNADKELAIGRSASVSLAKLEAEIAKCIVLCANCHRLRHHGR